MKILFIGNSHTYFNGLPYQVREMIDSAAGRGECQAWMCTAGGRDLAWHAEEGGTRMNLACHPWDYVVLQQKTHPFDGYEALSAGYAGLEPLVRSSGARALLYSTWKRKDAPESDQAEIDAAFSRLSGERGALLVPVGAAWRRARKTHPAIELYADDGSHASPAGSYLAACVFFRALTGASPVGLPARIAPNGAALVDLPPAEAAALQRIALEQ